MHQRRTFAVIKLFLFRLSRSNWHRNAKTKSTQRARIRIDFFASFFFCLLRRRVSKEVSSAHDSLAKTASYFIFAEEWHLQAQKGCEYRKCKAPLSFLILSLHFRALLQFNEINESSDRKWNENCISVGTSRNGFHCFPLLFSDFRREGVKCKERIDKMRFANG